MKTYYVLSGEGHGEGSWSIITTSNIWKYLKWERCGGDRWAKAYEATPGPFYSDVETGSVRDIPDDVKKEN